MQISPLGSQIIGYKVSLFSSVVWAIRELRLHQCDQASLEFNIKLDGRPLFGMYEDNNLCWQARRVFIDTYVFIVAKKV